MTEFIFTMLRGMGALLILGIFFTVMMVVCEYAYYKEAEEITPDTKRSNNPKGNP